MKGYFVADIIPVLRLTVNELVCEFIVDTGFTGELMLPSSKIQKLKLTKIGKEDYITADGHVYYADVYIGPIEWFGSRKTVSILESPAQITLMGMGLLRHCKTTISPRQNIVQLEK